MKNLKKFKEQKPNSKALIPSDQKKVSKKKRLEPYTKTKSQKFTKYLEEE